MKFIIRKTGIAGVVFVCLFIFQTAGFGFWIWSPKTKKWKNPKYSPKPSPDLQYKYAQEVFKNKDYKQAYVEFKKIINYFPGSKEAAEAQYYMGRCLEKMGKDYEAYLAYKKVIEKYPFSERIEEVVEREYNIAERLLDLYPKKILGVPIELTEHPSVEIYRSIVNNTPYSKVAPQSLYKMGLVLKRLSRFEEAEEAFQELIDNYPESEWIDPARYQLALCKVEKSPGVVYDHTELEMAEKTFREFVQNHPDAEVSMDAQEQLSILREKEAEKNYKIGEFYESQKAYESAKVYYNLVVDKFSENEAAKKAREKLKELP